VVHYITEQGKIQTGSPGRECQGPRMRRRKHEEQDEGIKGRLRIRGKYGEKKIKPEGNRFYFLVRQTDEPCY